MGTITAYALQAGIVLAAEYLVYKLLLAEATFSRFNRTVILAIYALALLAVPLASVAGAWKTAGTIGGAIIVGTPQATLLAETEPAGGSGWWEAVPAVYMAGAAVAAALTLLSYGRMACIICRGDKRRMGDATLVVAREKVAPFSWGRFLVVTAEDAANELIVEHELQHIRSRHSLDLLLAQLFFIFNWFNPAAHLLRRELGALHEYAVDAEIIHAGFDRRKYQMLLIRKTVGTGFQSIANSLNHSQLKNRLTMMTKSKSKSARRLCAAALLPAAVLAASMTEIPAIAQSLTCISAVSYGKGSEKPATVQATAATTPKILPAPATERSTTADERKTPPQYPGGEVAMMKALSGEVKYPAASMQKGAEGLVLVSFVVDADGGMKNVKVGKSSGNKQLDAEAVRAVKAAFNVKWIPATGNGKPVEAKHSVPVRFKLQ